MLRMTPLASAIVVLLLGIEAHATEETFDTHFMMGNMKGEQATILRLDDNQSLPASTISIFMLINNGAESMKLS